MAQQENQKSSTSSNSKKPKQKKIPQRGLGVAQLEKIRLAEQRKDEAAAVVAAAAAASVSVSVSVSVSATASVLRSSPMLFTSPSQYQNQSSSPSARPNPRPCFEFDTSGHLLTPLPSQPLFYPRNNYNGFGHQSTAVAPLPSQPVILGHSDYSLRGRHDNSCELSYDREGAKLYPGFMSQSRFSNDLNSTRSSSAVMQNPHFLQQQNQFPKMNASNSISSAVDLQIEPPSNQSYHSNYSNFRPPPWSEDDKMVGVKRTWPFYAENPPSPSLDGNHRSFLHRNSGVDERSPYENGGTTTFGPRSSFLRENPSDFAAHQYDSRVGLPEWNMKNVTRENGVTVDTVLTLSLPTAPTSPVKIKAKQPLEFPSPSRPECRNFNARQYQEYTGTPFFRQGESSQPQHIYSFFPPRPPQNNHIAANSGGQRSEVNNNVDLNLKL